MTPWQQHVASWKNCTACSACTSRRHVILARGTVPCDVLFVGEAPGKSEDSLNKASAGPAGHLLDQIIGLAWTATERSLTDLPTYAFTYLTACIPVAVPGQRLEPTEESIKACRERFAECLQLCRPRLVVALGKLAAKWLRVATNVPMVEIVHPATILA